MKRMKDGWPGLAFCLVLGMVAPAGAQTTPGPALQVATSLGGNTYRVGERIGLTLSFSAPAGKAFEISTASYDRSGRLMTEAFEVSTVSGWTDPLADHFRNGIILGGGLSGIADISVKPFVLDVNLNDWVRFDEPGDYTVTVRSSRFQRDVRVFPAEQEGRVASNAIKLHIVAATPEWQAATLAAALQRLQEPQTNNAASQARQDAVADIRYLATPAAIEAMAAGIRDDRPDQEGPFMLGLIGLPRDLRDEGVRALEARLDDPGFAITPSFFYTLAELGQRGSTPEEMTLAHQQAYAKVAAELGRKQGRARAETAVTLLNQRAGAQPANAQVASALASSLGDLRADEQANELMYQWSALKPHVSAMRLQAMLEPANNNFKDPRLTGIVLERLYELDPVAMKAKALALIESPKPALSVADVQFLPEQPLAAAEGFWAQGLLDTEQKPNQVMASRLLGLLARFGTGAAVPQVLSRLQGPENDCNEKAAGIAYLVRFAPDLAQPFFVQEAAEKAMCGGNLFQAMAEFTHGQVMIGAAIAALDSLNDRTVEDASRFLMRFGDATGEAPLRKHFEQWLTTWRGHGVELDQRLPGDGGGNWEKRELGTTLAHALMANEGWLTSADQARAIAARCVGEQMCVQLKDVAYAVDPPYRVVIFFNRHRQSYRVAQYETATVELFEAKVAQFPEGTAFTLEGMPGVQEEAGDPDEKTLRAIFTRHKMKVVEARTLPK